MAGTLNNLWVFPFGMNGQGGDAGFTASDMPAWALGAIQLDTGETLDVSLHRNLTTGAFDFTLDANDFRVYGIAFKPFSAGSLQAEPTFFTVTEDTAPQCFGLSWEADGDIVLKNTALGSTVATFAAGLTNNAWHTIVIEVQLANSGAWQVWLDGASLGSGSGADFFGTGSPEAAHFQASGAASSGIRVAALWEMSHSSDMVADTDFPTNFECPTYNHNDTGSAADAGLTTNDNALEVGTWDMIGQVPLDATTPVQYTTTSRNGAKAMDGPSAAGHSLGTVYGIGFGLWSFKGTGTGSHFMWYGHSAEAPISVSADMALATTSSMRMFTRQTTLPSGSNNLAGGFGENGASDMRAYEMWGAILHKPSAGAAAGPVLDADDGMGAVLASFALAELTAAVGHLVAEMTSNQYEPVSITPLAGTVTGTASLTATLAVAGVIFEQWHADAMEAWQIPPPWATPAVLIALLADEQAAREVLPVGAAPLAATVTGTASVTATLTTAGTNLDVSVDTEPVHAFAPDRDAWTAIAVALLDTEAIPVDGTVAAPGDAAPLEDDSALIALDVPPPPWVIHAAQDELPVSSAPLTGTITGTASLTATLTSAGTNLDVDADTAHVLSLAAPNDAFTAILAAQEGEVIPVSGAVEAPGDAPPGIDDSADIALDVPPPPYILHDEPVLPVSGDALTATVTGTASLTATLTAAGTTVDVASDTEVLLRIAPPVPEAQWAIEAAAETLPVNPKPLTATVTGTATVTATLTTAGTNLDVSEDTSFVTRLAPFRDATVALLSAIADSEVIPVDGTILVPPTTRWVVGSARYTARDEGTGRYVTRVTGNARFTTHDTGAARLEAES